VTCPDPIPVATSSPRYLIIILGPTATGKTAVAVELARELHTEIISADSRQFYSEMRIGTAMPAPELLAEIRHHFIGHLTVTHEYNVYRFEMEAVERINQLFTAHSHLVMVGGSGLYIDAVCKGIDELPNPDPLICHSLHEKYESEGIRPLQEMLKGLDEEYYAVVDKKNPKRLMRAIEVCLATGMKYSELRLNRQKQRSFLTVKIGLNLPRHELFDRIDKRVDEMIGKGLVDEVRALYRFRRLNALKSLGYREIIQYLDGHLTLEQAIARIKTHTHHYAKRQLTWFRRDPEITWFRPEQMEEIRRFVRGIGG